MIGQVAGTETAKPGMRAMTDDYGPTLLVSRKEEHFVRCLSRVERRRYAGMNPGRSHPRPLQRRVGGPEDRPGLLVPDSHPAALLTLEVGFESLLAYWKLCASGFEQSGRQTR
jgi:hypothetical protein